MRKSTIHPNYLTIILLFLFSGMAFGQIGYKTTKTADSKAVKSFVKAKRYAAQSEFKKALDQFDKALKKEPNYIDALLRKGGLLFDMKNYEESEQTFIHAKSIAPEYNALIYFSLANVQRQLKKYEEASENYNHYLRFDNNNEERKKRTLKYLKEVEFSAQAVKNPVVFNPIMLSDSINSFTSEYLPSITADGQTMIFTVRDRGQEDFYFSHKDSSGNWSERWPIYDLNTEYNEGSQSLSSDGKTMIFAQDIRTGVGNFDLYISKFDGEMWTKPTLLRGWINTRAWDSQPCLSTDGKSIYFASTRKGGYGGSDIYRSDLQENGIWSKARNLGPAINSSGNEESPFMHPDGQSLYFRSDGHIGMGDFDLFMAQKALNQDTFLSNKNLGYPINTANSEGALFISLDGHTGYFASDRIQRKNREGRYKNDLDIFKFDIPESIKPEKVVYLKVYLFDKNTKEEIDTGMVNFYNNITGKSILSYELDFEGLALVTLNEGASYGINIESPGYIFYSDRLDLASLDSTEEGYVKNLYLEPLEIVKEINKDKQESKPIILKNVFFETGSSELISTSMLEIDKLKDLLLGNNDISIQINGHTDNVGDEAANLQLSKDRAKTVYDYLVSKGIVANRMIYKGFGETVPIDTNETDLGRSNNRRTEFIILPKK